MHSAEHEGILQDLSPFGMEQNFWRRENMAGTRNATLRGKESFACNASAALSWATVDGHSLDHFCSGFWPDLPS